jgi:hypothetical protein
MIEVSGGGGRTTCDDENCIVVTLVVKKSVSFENVPPHLVLVPLMACCNLQFAMISNFYRAMSPPKIQEVGCKESRYS